MSVTPAGDAAGAPAALHIQGLDKRYAREPVLRGLTLRVEDGEFFALVGANGAGKTTCIKALLDLCGVDSGGIRIFGVSHLRSRARAPLAYLPERFQPPYYLSGSEFIGYTTRLHGAVVADGELHAMLDDLELDPAVLARPVGEYSKGMAQKLGLAACLLSGKRLLVLDEPMSGLDPKARVLAKQCLQAARDRGATVFFSTHLLADVEELCDRMGILDRGTLRFDGTPAECRARFAAATLETAYVRCLGG